MVHGGVAGMAGRGVVARLWLLALLALALPFAASADEPGLQLAVFETTGSSAPQGAVLAEVWQR